MVYRNPLTTAQVAELCRVSTHTALLWIRLGALPAFRTHQGHYRIWPADLRSFIIASGMDIDIEYVDERLKRVVIIDHDPSYARKLKHMIAQTDPGTEAYSTLNAREGLLLIGELDPQLAILGLELKDIPGDHVISTLGRRKKERSYSLLVLSDVPDASIKNYVMSLGSDEVLDKHADQVYLARTVHTLIHRRLSLDPRGGSP